MRGISFFLFILLFFSFFLSLLLRLLLLLLLLLVLVLIVFDAHMYERSQKRRRARKDRYHPIPTSKTHTCVPNPHIQPIYNSSI